MDERYEWLKHKLEAWEKEGLVTPEAAESIWTRERREEPRFSWTVPLFVIASLCLVSGLFFTGAGYWAHLSQDERFYLGILPVVLSLLVSALLLASDMANGETLLQRGFFGPAHQDHGSPVPLFAREGVGVFHGLALSVSYWMVHDSFLLDTDVYDLAGWAALFLLVMLYLTRSAGLGMIFAADTALFAWLSPSGGWPDAASWLLIFASLPFFFILVKENREKGGIAFAWAWMAALLLLTFCTAADRMWQVMFFSVAASLTWLLGAAFRAYGWIGSAFRFFGGAAVFGVLFVSAFGSMWQTASGNWALWLLLILFLLADGALLFRLAGKAEWLSLVAGCTPFVMAAGGFIAMWDRSGAVSAVLVSIFILIMAAALMARGIQMRRNWQIGAGLALLAGDGIIRVADAALTYGERGAFFLFAGAFAAFLTGAVYVSSRRMRKSLPPVDAGVEEGGGDHE